RPAERGNDSDGCGQEGERALSSRIKKTFAAKPLLELLESELQRAKPARLHLVRVKLERAAGVEDVNVSVNHDFDSIGQLEPQPCRGRPEHHHVDGALRVL